MGILAPAALALTGLLGAVVAMYMLKLRRSDERVPSTMLWRTIVHEPPANAPWQPPRRSLLLFLQLVALSLLVFALARPFLPTEQPAGDVLVLLIDRSASMGATDVAPSRLEAAKRDLLEAVEGSPAALITVVAFDSVMDVLVSGESDHDAVREAVKGLEPRPVAGDISDALAFAQAFAGGTDAQVIVYSDGNFALEGDSWPAGVSFEPIGADVGNQSLDTLALTEGFEAAPSAFVQVANHGKAPVTSRVELSVDDALFDARDIQVPAHGRANFTLALPDTARLITAVLRDDDPLELDDTAVAVRPESVRARVTLVSGGSRFLETALGLLPNVESVHNVGAADAGGPYGLADVTVLDGLAPVPLPPGNLLLFAPPRSLGPEDGVALSEAIDVVGGLTDPVPVSPDSSPLAAGAELDQVAVLRAQALRLGTAWTPVLETEVDGERWPLIATGSLLGRPAAVVAFDVRDSDLPLRTAFPLTVARLIEHLSPPTVAGLPRWVAAGDPVTLQVPPRASRLRIVTPAGEEITPVEDPSGAKFADTLALGEYRVLFDLDGETTEAWFAVQLAAPTESDLRPRRHAAAADPDVEGSEVELVRGRRELWWPLGLCALGFVCAEWVLFHRRGLPALRGDSWPGSGLLTRKRRGSPVRKR